VLTLSSLIDIHAIQHVDLLKIDAEWAEESILRGIAEWHLSSPERTRRRNIHTAFIWKLSPSQSGYAW
jgi:hypothetical protein